MFLGPWPINITKSKSNLIGHQVSLLFALTQHTRDRVLLENIKQYLCCGEVKHSTSRPTTLTFKVVNFSNNIEKIIPFFRKYGIIGIKREDFNS